MVISMRQHASKEEIEHVCERIQEFGYKVHSIVGESRVVIGVVGVGDVTACLESLEATPGVETAVRISAPYKFVSREFRKERSAIKLNGIEIGGAELIVMAGPASRPMNVLGRPLSNNRPASSAAPMAPASPQC